MQEEVDKSVAALRSGGIILFPSDHAWSLGVDATNSSAVERLISLKGEKEKQRLTVLVEKDARLLRHVKEVPELAWDLIDLSEEPLTIVYPNGLGVAPRVLTEDGSVAIRLVKDDFGRAVIAKYNRPIVSTSANISGEEIPRTFSNLEPGVLDSVDYTVNLRRSETLNHTPSRILKLDLDGTIEIIRQNP